jgi:hypothetical protein
MSGGTWNEAGLILFSPSVKQGILKISAAGGIPSPVTQLDTARQEIAHLWPYFLTDGRHFLYLARSAKAELTGIFVGSLDGKPEFCSMPIRGNLVPPGNLLHARRKSSDPGIRSGPTAIRGELASGGERE